MTDLSEYEAARLRNIAENAAMLRTLGLEQPPASAANELPDVDALLQQQQKSKTPARRASGRKRHAAAIDEAVLPPRRSSRRRAEPKRYTDTDVSERPDRDDPAYAPTSPDSRSNSPTTPTYALSVQQANEAAIQRCTDAIAGLKASLPPLIKPDPDGETAVLGNAWRAQAVARWGPGIAKESDIPDWAAFVQSRTSTPPPLPSPFALLQERFASDMWYLLCACILMSRVSSVEVKERCINGFFARCPSPTTLLQVDPAELQPILHSLGLFPQRLEAIVDVTKKFLTLPVFKVGLDKEDKIKGIGVFGVDSFRIFCLDDLEAAPADRALRSFVAWRHSLAKVTESETSDTAKLAQSAQVKAEPQEEDAAQPETPANDIKPEPVEAN